MDGSQSNPKVYLIIENPKKSNNLGPIIRCAAAYSITQLVFVGYHKCSVEGSHGSNKYVDTTNFPTFSQAKEYVINEIGKPSNNDRDRDLVSSSSSSSEESNIDFVGIMGAFECVSAVKENNIMDQTVPILQSKTEDGIFMNLLQHKSQKFDESKYQVEESLKSYPIHLQPFYCVGGNKKKIHDNSNDDKTITNRKHICFVISKNNRGFPKENADICNYFVHVPIASHLTLEEEEEEKTNNNPISISSPYRFIDTQSCLSIVLHHFTAWTNCYKKGSFISQKYVTGNNNNDKGRGSSSIDRVEQQRKRKTQERQQKHKEEETFVDNALDGSWGDNLFDMEEE